MKLALRNQYLTALDVSVVALHWAAVPWESVAPGVAAQIRRIANALSERASALRREEAAAAAYDDDPLDPPTENSEVPERVTEKVTQLYGDKPPK